MKVPPNAKYTIIQEMTRRDNNLLNISWLCEAAGVSRSGYYYWLSTEKDRQLRDEMDRKDFETILEAYQYRGYICSIADTKKLVSDAARFLKTVTAFLEQ